MLLSAANGRSNAREPRETLRPALEDKIAQHVQLYPTDSDGHLQATGYGVVAQVVAETIRRYAPRP